VGRKLFAIKKVSFSRNKFFVLSGSHTSQASRKFEIEKKNTTGTDVKNQVTFSIQLLKKNK
jgi:hypothetical protein